MNVTFKVETLYASFDNPHHVLVMGVPAVGVPNEAGMQNIGTVPLAGEKPGPLGRLSGRWAHRLST